MNKDNTRNKHPHNKELSRLTLWAIFYGEKDKSGTGLMEEKENAESDDFLDFFWNTVREEKVLKNDFDFSDFIFPTFSDQSFWQDDESKIFSKFANFRNTRFLDEANFESVIFKGAANFSYANFESLAYFSMSKFHGYSDFNEAKFTGIAHFSYSIFYDEVSFQSTIFSEIAQYRFVTFSGIINFSLSKFLSDADFTSSEFEKDVNFSSTVFSKIVVFVKTSFSVADFVNITFVNESRCTFKEWAISQYINFEDVIFHEKVQFQRCDMGNVQFKSSDFSKVNFSNCKFLRAKNRIVFVNDFKIYRPTKEEEREEKKGVKKEVKRDYGELANIYRQLKRNLMESKNWREAGDAYRSEMEITQVLVWQEFRSGKGLKFFNWLIMAVHGKLSGYQQSLTRPLFYLCLVWIVMPGLLFLFDTNTYSLTCLKWLNALEVSFSAALPIAGKIVTEGYKEGVFFLLLFERILSIILLTFFGLAIRARLRQ